MTNWAREKQRYLRWAHGEFYDYATEMRDTHTEVGKIREIALFIEIYETLAEAITLVQDTYNFIIRNAMDGEAKKHLEKLSEIQKRFWDEFQDYVPPVTPATEPPEAILEDTNISPSKVVDTLDTFTSVDDADEYLKGLALKKPQYRAIIDYSKMTWIPKNASRPEMRRQLIDYHVATRLRSQVIRNLNASVDMEHLQKNA